MNTPGSHFELNKRMSKFFCFMENVHLLLILFFNDVIFGVVEDEYREMSSYTDELQTSV